MLPFHLLIFNATKGFVNNNNLTTLKFSKRAHDELQYFATVKRTEKMRNKRKLSKRGRYLLKTEFANAEPSKVKVILKDNCRETFDSSNQLCLPSKKSVVKKKIKIVQPTTTKLLSKSQRKKLEKIVEKKKKKGNRASLLEALTQVQVPLEELNQLTSVAAVQTKGLKRHFAECRNDDDIFSKINQSSEITQVNSISGSKRQKRILAAILAKNSAPAENNPNVVGFDMSASSESDDDDDNDDVSVMEIVRENKEVFSEENKESNDISVDVNKLNDVKVESNQLKNKPNEVIPVNETTECKENETQVHLIDINSIKVEPVEKPKRQPAIFVPVDRDPKIQEERLKLPILPEEQVIMEAINENSVVIIAGETGSGKTTQVPQFLYEAGYARNNKIIGITQPRRVAAISMSKRVAQEMSLDGNEVSYLIRFEGNVTENTKIKFMTDGVLLKEIQSDFVLSKYSVIILDEAHERNVYTDILIGLLSRIVPLRNKRNDPLKLIIMSATLRLEDFTENTRLFKTPPPTLKVDARQYPVTVHFNRKTPDDYLKACFIKACKIHTKLPEGGILIFVTGQQEVKFLVRKLKKHFPMSKQHEEYCSEDNSKQAIKNFKKANKKGRDISNIEINLDKYSVVPNDDTELDLLEGDDFDDLDALNEDVDYSTDIVMGSQQEPLWVLPMYSLLPSAEQAKVFVKPPQGCRLCVVSTNVAETSLTIPNIKYVVDSGKTKTKLYDKTTGVTSFHITWCSKASANQRAGRAGRIAPGHCYRLYSSAVFNDEFPQFSIPEIQQKPVDDLILQMKSMNIVKVFNFPFPTSPDLLQLKSGEKRLQILGALEKPTGKDEWSSKLTKLGETMASFPVSPRFAKMLALSYQHDLLQYTVCIVAALSVPEIFLNDSGSQWSQIYRNWAGLGNSFLLGDVMVLLRAVGAAECSRDNLEEFCSRNGLRLKAIKEVRKLRVQLTNQINLNIPDLNLSIDPNLKPPTDTQAKLLRQIVLSGLADHVARRVTLDEIADDKEKVKLKRAYRDSEMEDPIFLHSSAVLKKHMPDWIVYQEVYETNKLYMRGVTAIEPEWLPVFVPFLCNMSEPLMEPPPKYDASIGKVMFQVNGTFGKAAFSLPTMEIPLTNTLFSYKWFAKFFLEGEVFPKLKKYTDSLLSTPAVMTKSWAKLQPRTEMLLNALLSKEANTKDQILSIWKENAFYLLEAYKAWLPASAHESVTLIWPPI